MANAVRFKHTNVTRQKGELARFKVVQGPDYGAVYVVVGPKATIGRGEENDLVISDLKSSRIHAEMNLTAAGWIIKDKGSANGILCNGKATREARLKLGDTITLGESTLEFTTSDAGTMMLVAPPRSMTQIQADQEKLAEQQKKLRSMGLNSLFGSGEPSQPNAGPSQSRGRLILFAVVGVGLLLLFLDDPTKPVDPKKSAKKEDGAKDLAQYLPNPDVNKTAESIFKDGFREYIAGNLNRARTQFETVLQISPGHALATIYLENCTKSMENEVKVHMSAGKKSLSAGKLRDARSHFDRVMRLLYRAQSDPDFIESKKMLEEVQKRISGEVKN